MATVDHSLTLYNVEVSSLQTFFVEDHALIKLKCQLFWPKCLIYDIYSMFLWSVWDSDCRSCLLWHCSRSGGAHSLKRVAMKRDNVTIHSDMQGPAKARFSRCMIRRPGSRFQNVLPRLRETRPMAVGSQDAGITQPRSHL